MKPLLYTLLGAYALGFLVIYCFVPKPDGENRLLYSLFWPLHIFPKRRDR